MLSNRQNNKAIPTKYSLKLLLAKLIIRNREHILYAVESFIYVSISFRS